MFTVELRVNGTLVSHIYGHNAGVHERGKSLYHYEYFRVNTPKQTVSGNVKHDPDDKLEKLIAIILTDVEKKRKKS